MFYKFTILNSALPIERLYELLLKSIKLLSGTWQTSITGALKSSFLLLLFV